MTLVEIFLTVIGISFYALRAAYTQAQRHSSVVKFNNPDDDVKIMICSSRSAATSFNAQQACSDMVILEWPWNLSTVDQMVGMLWRVGQTREVNVRILSVDHSHDQVLQARTTKKVLAQLASQATASDEVEGETNNADKL